MGFIGKSVIAATLALGLGVLSPGSPVGAQELAPHLEGRVEVDLSGGRIAADVCLTGIPLRGDTVTILLNRAMTIKRITGTHASAAHMELEPGGAAVRYTFLGGTPAPGDRHRTSACLEYSGSHPIYEVEAGDYRADDLSSLIAFNGRALRARGVSRWHPTPYDPRQDIAVEALSYSLNVVCDLCSRIYINGGGLSEGPEASFTSGAPRELLLIAGDLAEQREEGFTFIGEEVPPDTAAAFAATLRQLQEFLTEFTGLPFGDAPDIVLLRPVREPRRGQLWGFFSDPALVLIGMSVPELVRALDGTANQRRSVTGFLAHELAHRYFAWTLGGGTTQRDLFGEPFATYLELKAVRHFFGEQEYATSVGRLERQVTRGPQPTPLDRAEAADFTRSSYRYGYSPYILLSLEAAIGEDAMRSMLREMLSAPAGVRYGADFSFLVAAAEAVGVRRADLDAWRERCIESPLAEERCLLER